MRSASARRARRTRDWAHEPPVQERAQVTLEAFAAAAEELLRDRPFENISVRDIARAAGRPLGSFYARFPSKDALLPYLYARYHAGLGPILEARFDRVDWDALDFEACVAAMVDLLIGLYVERPWLVRALALFSRLRPEALPADIVETRRRSYDRAVVILLRHRPHITHEDPEAAIRYGIFMVSTIAREKLLFAQAPLSRITPMDRDTLRAHLVRSLAGFLGGTPRAGRPAARRAAKPPTSRGAHRTTRRREPRP
jgi:AcrR family transcriptional regulator